MRVLVVSTSSPMVSVWLDGESTSEFAPRRASQAAIQGIQSVLARTGLALADVDGFIADTGPGSFTGVRVGVTLIKTLGWSLGRPVAGLNAHCLCPAQLTALPVKKGQWVCREADGSVTVVDGPPPADAFGDPEKGEFPAARLAEAQLATVCWMDPAELTPEYGTEPAISQAKRPHIMGPA